MNEIEKLITEFRQIEGLQKVVQAIEYRIGGIIC